MKQALYGTSAVLAILISSAGAAAQTTHNVQLVGFTFIPPTLKIDTGDTVHWEWVEGVHNVESGIIVAGAGVPDGNFLSGAPTGVVGTTFDVVFDQAFLDAQPMPGNVYPYYCLVHTGLNMAGTITVNAPPAVPAMSVWGAVALIVVMLAAATTVFARRSRVCVH